MACKRSNPNITYGSSLDMHEKYLDLKNKNKEEGKIDYVNRFSIFLSDRILRMLGVFDVAAQASDLYWYPYKDNLIGVLRPPKY